MDFIVVLAKVYPKNGCRDSVIEIAQELIEKTLDEILIELYEKFLSEV